MKNIPKYLSHCRLETSLGSGGMGTVYRASIDVTAR
jgi:hypothetical protein